MKRNGERQRFDRTSFAPRCSGRPTSGRCRPPTSTRSSTGSRARRSRSGASSQARADRRALPRRPSRARLGAPTCSSPERFLPSEARNLRAPVGRFRPARARGCGVTPTSCLEEGNLMSEIAAKRRTAGRSGTDGRAPLHDSRRPPLRRGRVGAPRCADRRSARTRPSSSARSSSRPTGPRTRPTSSPRSTSAASSDSPERERSVKQMISPGRRDDRRLGARGRLLRHRGGRRRVRGRADPHPPAPEGGLQQPGVVQRRVRGAAAVLRLLHPLASRTRWSRSSTGTPRRG